MASSGVTSALPTLSLGKLVVGRQGLGCMGLSRGWYGDFPVEESTAIALVRSACQNAAPCVLSTAHFYGSGSNETMLGKALKGIPRSSAVIASKWGVELVEGGPPRVDTSHANGKRILDETLARLGTDHLDVWILRCMGKPKDLEATMLGMKEEVQAGRVRELGVSEMSPKDMRRAHAIHPIACVELEWSLFARDAEEEVIPLCRELGIAVLAYSPISRGVLSGSYSTEKLAAGDIRHHDDGTTYTGANRDKNLKLVERLSAIAAPRGLTAGQLAIAWVHNKGDEAGVACIPIPGTRKEAYLEQNQAAARIKLTKEEMAEIEAAVPHAEVAGGRTRHVHATHKYDDAPAAGH